MDKERPPIASVPLLLHASRDTQQHWGSNALSEALPHTFSEMIQVQTSARPGARADFSLPPTRRIVNAGTTSQALSLPLSVEFVRGSEAARPAPANSTETLTIRRAATFKSLMECVEQQNLRRGHKVPISHSEKKEGEKKNNLPLCALSLEMVE
jgi:hypothetical protein